VSKSITITWTKSAIGYSKRQKDTIRSLGLRRLHQSVEKEDTPEIRGMVEKVKHLVTVEEEEG
jgi:large subunit ribosomal protein L30